MKRFSCATALAIVAALSFASIADAWPRGRSIFRLNIRGTHRGVGGCSTCDASPGNACVDGICAMIERDAVTDKAISAETVSEALDEVNAARAKRGLRPFVKCDLLTTGAVNAATHRAARRIEGHIPGGDFAFLPAGASATAAGCAAWPTGYGWGACCTYESFTHAGAAYAMGNDGRRYMHLFVR